MQLATRAILALSAPFLAAAAMAQPTVTNTPFAPSLLSADGSTIVGVQNSSIVRFNRFTGTTTVCHADALSQRVSAVSGNGSRVAGNGQTGPSTAWTWTEATGVVPITMPGTSGVKTSCISRDGSTVGGVFFGSSNGFYHSYVWTPADGPRAIPEGGNYSTWLHALSPDGLKGVGSGSSGLGTSVALWGSTYLWCSMLPIPIQYRGLFAEAMTPDMRTVVGHAYETNIIQPGLVWSDDAGLTILHSPYPSMPQLRFDGVDDDGKVAVATATATSAATGVGMVWVRGSGLMTADAFFAAHHVPLAGASVVKLVGISASGRVFAGQKSSGTGFIIDLGPCGSADFNHDGSEGTDADIEAFFSCLAGNCCPLCDSADFNYDGDAGTDQDIEAFFRVLSGGNC